MVVTRSQRTWILGGAAALVAAVIAIITAVSGGGSTASRENAAPVGAFELFDGSETTFADFAGKPVVVNFWASWCPACVAELPEFESVHQQLADEITFLGIANTDRRGAAESLAASVGLSYTLADDPEGALFREFGLIAMPSTVFIDADGNIHDVVGGQLNERLLLERIDDLVGAP